MERWSGRVAVVTGASAGIGAAIVRDLASAGVRVVGLARREDKLQVLADELAGQGSPGELICVRCDVSDTSDVQAAFERIEEQVGAVSVLVNNAGVMIPQRVQDMSNEAMAAIVNTNILGLTSCCREGLRSELKHMHRDGYRIKVTSVSPGPVLTDMFGDDLRDAISPEEVQRLLKASDISRAVCFALASPPDVEMVEMTIQATGHLT
ncbi:hypothetical protein FOCC_FOCC000179 [Frankliniella occidentalis]|nr:hypothetical protein FOCC_FOCC000179 [Frankliniella occidentalis]